MGEGVYESTWQREPRVVVGHPRQCATAGMCKQCPNQFDAEAPITKPVIDVQGDDSLRDMDFERTAESRSPTDVFQHGRSAVVDNSIGQFVHRHRHVWVVSPRAPSRSRGQPHPCVWTRGRDRRQRVVQSGGPRHI